MLALLLALASPELELRGISVSYGNTVVENAYRNTVEIMRRAGKRITLGVGARRPLKRALAGGRRERPAAGAGVVRRRAGPGRAAPPPPECSRAPPPSRQRGRRCLE